MGRLNTDAISPIVFNGLVAPLSPVVKDLRLYIDSTLDHRAQVTHVSQKVTGNLRTLCRLKNLLPTKTKCSQTYAVLNHSVNRL